MSMAPTRQNLIKAIMTNPSLNDDEKSLLVEEFINEINKEYPDLKYHATKQDVTQTELKLTKEIEKVRLEIKELDNKASKEREKIRLDLTKEIEKVRLEIKELDIKASEEREKIRLEIKDLDKKASEEREKIRLDLTKEIEKVRLEIKELDVKLTNKISETKTDLIRWVVGVFTLQTGLLITAIFMMFKLFKGA